MAVAAGRREGAHGWPLTGYAVALTRQHHFLPSPDLLPLRTDAAFVGDGEGIYKEAGKTNNLFMWAFFPEQCTGETSLKLNSIKAIAACLFLLLPRERVNHKSLPFKRQFCSQ